MKSEGHSTSFSDTIQRKLLAHCPSRLLTLGAGGVCGVGDVAGQTDMERAAEAAVLLGRGGEFHYTLHVVELPTHRDHTASNVLA